MSCKFNHLLLSVKRLVVGLLMYWADRSHFISVCLIYMQSLRRVASTGTVTFNPLPAIHTICLL